MVLLSALWPCSFEDITADDPLLRGRGLAVMDCLIPEGTRGRLSRYLAVPFRDGVLFTERARPLNSTPELRTLSRECFRTHSYNLRFSPLAPEYMQALLGTERRADHADKGSARQVNR